MIVLPTMLGRVPSTGVVMFTTACIVSTTPGIHVVVTAGLGRPAGVWSNTCTRGGRVWPAGFGGSVMSKAKSLAFTLASGWLSGKHSSLRRASGFGRCVRKHWSPAPPPSGLIQMSVRVESRPALRFSFEYLYPPVRVMASACGGCISL